MQAHLCHIRHRDTRASWYPSAFGGNTHGSDPVFLRESTASPGARSGRVWGLSADVRTHRRIDRTPVRGLSSIAFRSAGDQGRLGFLRYVESASDEIERP